MRPELQNGATLAFIGDAVLSLMVREHLINLGLTKTKELQIQSIRYVSAVAQAKFIQYLLDQNELTQEETQIYLRGRNHKSLSKAKNTDILTYRQATGFESLLGYWYLRHETDRLEHIWNQMKTNI